MIKLVLLAFAVSSCASQAVENAARISDIEEKVASNAPTGEQPSPEKQNSMPIAGWTHGNADLMYSVGGPPVIIGSVSASGEVNLDLPDVVETTQNFGLIFGCDGQQTLQMTNAEATYEATPVALLVANFAERKRYGYVAPASSAEMGQYKLNMPGTTTAQGAYYQWFFFSEAASANGKCSSAMELSPGKIVPVTSTFSLEFQQGWNLVETRIKAFQQTAEGLSFPTNTEFSTLGALPESVVWSYVEDLSQ